jgi:hypothetical protein
MSVCASGIRLGMAVKVAGMHRRYRPWSFAIDRKTHHRRIGYTSDEKWPNTGRFRRFFK